MFSKGFGAENFPKTDYVGMLKLFPLVDQNHPLGVSHPETWVGKNKNMITIMTGDFDIVMIH